MIAGFHWRVPALVLEWHDGDTCIADIDNGWRHRHTRESVRLMGLYCEETDDPDLTLRAIGFQQRDHAIALCPVGTIVKLTSKALGKNARWSGAQESLSRTLGDIELPDGRDFAKTMVADGFGRATPGHIMGS